MTENDGFVWCIYCSRTFTIAEAARLDKCPYDDCDANVNDGWDWNYVRDVNVGFPVVPVRGVAYLDNSEN